MRSRAQRAFDPSFFRELLLPVDDSDEVRVRIVDAGRAAMLDFGIRRMTIDDVARRAGIGRPTLYRRFATKDEIVRAVWLRETRQLIATVWETVKHGPSPEQRIVHAFVVASRTMARHELAQRLLATEPETVMAFMRSDAGTLIDAGRALIAPHARVLQDAGHLTAVDVEDLLEVLARLFLSVTFIPSSRVAADDEASLRRFAEQALLPLLRT